METKELIESGLLRIAQLPPGNPTTWDEKARTIFLIEHDYPGRSPQIWNTVYRQLGWPFETAMLVGETANLPRFFSAFREDENYLGGGLGIGFKDEAVKAEALDSLADSAKLVKAANVVVKEGQKLIGHNTDGAGFLKSLEEKFFLIEKDLSSASVMLLGAGGTANAIAFALAPKVRSIFILNRTESKAEKLANEINSFFGKQIAFFGGEDQIEKLAQKVEIIINSSTKGATGSLADFSALAPTDSLEKNLDKSRLILQSLPSGTLISDINLVTEETPLIKQADLLGLPTLNGKPMVLFQAIKAFCLVHSGLLKEKGVKEEQIKKIIRGLIL